MSLLLLSLLWTRVFSALSVYVSLKNVLHPRGRTLISDWLVNSFLMDVYDNFGQNLLSKARLKKFLIDNHY